MKRKVELLSGTEEIECTFCTEILSLPVHHCENGHIVCEACMEKHERCPTCGSRQTTMYGPSKKLVADEQEPRTHVNLGKMKVSEWEKLTSEQHHSILQQLIHDLRRQQQLLELQQRLEDAQGLPSNFSERPKGFGVLMALLQPHLLPDQFVGLTKSYQKLEENDITNEKFICGARKMIGDEVLLTIFGLVLHQLQNKIKRKHFDRGQRQMVGNKLQIMLYTVWKIQHQLAEAENKQHLESSPKDTIASINEENAMDVASETFIVVVEEAKVLQRLNLLEA